MGDGIGDGWMGDRMMVDDIDGWMGDEMDG